MYISKNFVDFLIEAARWKSAVAAGKLSKKAIQTIKKAVQKTDKLYVKQLIKQGKVKEAEVYLKNNRISKSPKAWLTKVKKDRDVILSKDNLKDVVEDLGRSEDVKLLKQKVRL